MKPIFALFAAITTSSTIAIADITEYQVAKLRVYEQTSSAPPSIPVVYVFDAYIDDDIVQEIERTLEQIKTLGMTTIIVEQNAIAALHLADRAIILDMGQVVFDGAAQEVLENAELRQEYLAI